MICWWMRKTSCKAKIPPDKFQVTTPKNPLIKIQAVISIMNLITTLKYLKLTIYSWTFTPISNWTWSCRDFFLRIDPSTWLTPSNRLIVVGCKVLYFKAYWRSRSSWIQNPKAHKTRQLLTECMSSLIKSLCF